MSSSSQAGVAILPVNPSAGAPLEFGSWFGSLNITVGIELFAILSVMIFGILVARGSIAAHRK